MIIASQIVMATPCCNWFGIYFASFCLNQIAAKPENFNIIPFDAFHLRPRPPMKIAVIGAGTLGVTTSLELISHGHEVKVFEKNAGVAQEASFATAGFIGPGLTHSWVGPGMVSHILKRYFSMQGGIKRHGMGIPAGWLLKWSKACASPHFEMKQAAMHRLAQYNQEVLKSITEQHGLGFEMSAGSLILLKSESELATYQTHLKLLQQTDIPFKQLDAMDTLAVEPALSSSERLWGSIYFPNDAVANCRQFTLLAKQIAESQGVEFLTGKEVLPLSATNPLNIQVHGMPEEKFDHVIVCSGIGTKHILKHQSIPLPLLAIHGYTVSAAVREPIDAPLSGVLDAGSMVSVSRMGQRIRVSGIYEHGQNPKKPIDAVSLLYKVLNDWFPGAAKTTEIVQAWKGTRDVLPDGLPLIGSSGIPGLWLNAGHGNHGWSFACGTARLIADMISGRECEIDLQGLGIERY